MAASFKDTLMRESSIVTLGHTFISLGFALIPWGNNSVKKAISDTTLEGEQCVIIQSQFETGYDG